MKRILINSDPEVKEVFQNYPSEVKHKMHEIRELIIQVAQETEEIQALQETLKWGEPSYISKLGSTLRIDWKEKNPNNYSIYFKCTSKLVPSFKSVYGDVFNYEKNRAIIFNINEELPDKVKLKECIKAALLYHKLKNQENLGLK